MTALLEALRRIETRRSSSAPVVEPTPAPSVAAKPSAAAGSPKLAVVEALPNDEVVVCHEAVVLSNTIAPVMPRRERRAAARPGEPPLSARATIADDVAGAAAAIAHRFRRPALVALVTCGDLARDTSLVDAVSVGLDALGHPTAVFHADAELSAAYSLRSLDDLRSGRGYHLLHASAESALEQTPLLGAADGVVLLVELERTPIAEAEAVVGNLRREAVAVSGILLIS